MEVEDLFKIKTIRREGLVPEVDRALRKRICLMYDSVGVKRSRLARKAYPSPVTPKSVRNTPSVHPVRREIFVDPTKDDKKTGTLVT